MAIKINLEKYGHKKKGFVGFSYSTLFLNFLVPLFRGDFKNFIKFFFIWLVTILPSTLIDNFSHHINNYNNPTIIKFLTSLFDVKYKYVFLVQSLIVIALLIIHFIIWFFIAKSYNKKYTKQLLNNGYIPVENDDYTLALLEEYLEYFEKDKNKKEIELYNNIMENTKKEEKKKFYITIITILLFSFYTFHKISNIYDKLGDVTHFEYTQKNI